MGILETTLRIFFGVLLVGANAFFVAVEFALTQLRSFDASEFEDDPRLRRAWEMTEELEIYLTGCQLGISTTSVLLGVIAEPAVTALIAPIFGLFGVAGTSVRVAAVVVSVILINLFHKIWGEQAPTYFGVERPKLIARHLAWIHDIFCRVTRPIIMAGDSLAKATLRLFGVEITRSWVRDDTTTGTRSERATDAGAGSADTPRLRSHGALREEMLSVLSRSKIPADRREEVLNTLEAGVTPIRDVMVPRDEIVALDTGMSWPEVLDVLTEHAYSRYPVVRGDIDELVGILYLPGVVGDLERLRRGEVVLADMVVAPYLVPADTDVAELIDNLQAEKHEIAIVTEPGERPAVIGLVTATDALEAIVGQLHDPYDIDAHGDGRTDQRSTSV